MVMACRGLAAAAPGLSQRLPPRYPHPHQQQQQQQRMSHSQHRAGCSISRTTTTTTPSRPNNSHARSLRLRSFSLSSRCLPGARALGPRGMSMRVQAVTVGPGSVAAPAPTSSPPPQFDVLEVETDDRGLTRLQLKEEGYSTWVWQGLKINYVAAGPAQGAPCVGPPIVLVHGFGASVYHWRYNIPELAKYGRVYALDLVGFGWSEKALIEYNSGVWRQQVAEFIQEVVGEPAVLAGNSVGGYTALATAAFYEDQVRAVALINSAGRFKEEEPEGEGEEAGGEADAEGVIPVQSSPLAWLVERAQALAKRVGIYIAFQQARQPARIQQVLETVYADRGSLDPSLTRSIALPATQPNAQEVYYRLLTQVLFHPSALPVNKLLRRIRDRGPAALSPAAAAAGSPLPVLLLWGELDPWCTPKIADKIMSYYPEATRVNVAAGHCPHDEAPGAVNEALLDWWRTV